jgi:hypothetical protein
MEPSIPMNASEILMLMTVKLKMMKRGGNIQSVGEKVLKP